MSSLLKSTLNTRALPTGNLRYIRSDYPGNLSKEEVNWLLNNNVVTVIDLREEKEYQIKSVFLNLNQALPTVIFRLRVVQIYRHRWKKWQISILECLMNR